MSETLRIWHEPKGCDPDDFDSTIYAKTENFTFRASCFKNGRDYNWHWFRDDKHIKHRKTIKLLEKLREEYVEKGTLREHEENLASMQESKKRVRQEEKQPTSRSQKQAAYISLPGRGPSKGFNVQVSIVPSNYSKADKPLFALFVHKRGNLILQHTIEPKDLQRISKRLANLLDESFPVQV